MKCNCFNDKYSIYEDDKCIAFVADNAITPAQIIIAPKEHYPIIELMPDDLLANCFNVANDMSKKLFERTKIQGTNIIIHNGFPSQDKAHFSINIIPRSENDGLNLEWSANEAKQEDLNDSALFIKDALEKIDAKKPVVIEEKTPEEGEAEKKIDEFLDKIRRMP